MPELRRSYIPFPCRAFTSTLSASLPWQSNGPIAARRPCFFAMLCHPPVIDGGHPPLSALVHLLRRKNMKAARIALRMCWQWWPLRYFVWNCILNVSGYLRAWSFGTFSVSVYSALGAESLHPLSPVPFVVNYGPIDENGEVDVRIIYDHSSARRSDRRAKPSPSGKPNDRPRRRRTASGTVAPDRPPHEPAGTAPQQVSGTLLHEDHPRHAEAVGNHAEARGEEGFGEGHVDLAAVAGAAKTRRLRRGVGRVSESVKPWKLGLLWQRPSDAMITDSPMRTLACITLFSMPGACLPGGGGSGLSLNRISISTFAPRAFL